ncbi:MAG: hypothetical protein US11_C0001G0093 [Candidatus Roizmanbacteria bacterium GW2011_GWA2_36_23]|uniref:RNA polymerase sigma-70 region 4 domain-containing protein n=1 Tax=Candidatus Roizmanbacteria bacterium GW2011_GWA2_36_23 TaxID=1618480 RepID=A0A0G0GQS3_9BACT|nr:MAG: hypothetical protein US11_C0001G0093 [Candidatus Roizmanbacteria bacterium GW2011_GWA2_36_23]
MAKNLLRYYQAWLLRKQGKTLLQIGKIMGFSLERARVMVNYINFIIKRKDSHYLELKKIIAKPRKLS